MCYSVDAHEAGHLGFPAQRRRYSRHCGLFGYFANHLTWLACKLGFKWGIYCDVNYYDNAGYWIWENQRHVRKRFSHFDETGKLPYHRMLLYK